ncbi:hypothetical protein QYF36_021896 [Acer negundo]|nr:hypothetical protein QYF36_021896 [Acer negundo]
MSGEPKTKTENKRKKEKKKKGNRIRSASVYARENPEGDESRFQKETQSRSALSMEYTVDLYHRRNLLSQELGSQTALEPSDPEKQGGGIAWAKQGSLELIMRMKSKLVLLSDSQFDNSSCQMCKSQDQSKALDDH